MSTTAELITQIALAGAFPNDGYFTTANYLSFLNDAQQTEITPLLLRLNEEYLLDHKDYTIAANTTYRIPTRAIGAKLRSVMLITSSGAYTRLDRLFEEDRPNNMTGYYLVRNSIELSSDITTGTLRLSYICALPTLVATSSVAQISSINTSTNQVVVTSLPSTISTSTPIDFIQGASPFDLLDKDITISSVSGTTLTFSSLPSGLAVNDYIALSTQSCIPLIPSELNPLLAQAVLVKALSAKKDKQAEVEQQKLDKMKQTLLEMLDPRINSTDVKFFGQGIVSFLKNR